MVLSLERESSASPKDSDDMEERSLRVGIFENKPSGAGPWVRASAWLAASVLASEVWDPLLDVRITLEIDGRIDGPSAGGLLAAGMLAAWIGVPLASSVTMTGAVLPDGSIGPVGGIAAKIRAAAEAGFKTVVVPACQRVEFHEPDMDEVVDLWQTSQESGIELVFASNIRQACTAFGLDYPYIGLRNTPSGYEPNLPPETERSFAQSAIRVFDRLAKDLKAFDLNVTPKDCVAGECVSNWYLQAGNDIQKAHSDLLTGNWPAALDASIGALAALRTIQLWQKSSFEIRFDLAQEGKSAKLRSKIEPLYLNIEKKIRQMNIGADERALLLAAADACKLEDLTLIDWYCSIFGGFKEEYGKEILGPRGFWARLFDSGEEEGEQDPKRRANQFASYATSLEIWTLQAAKLTADEQPVYVQGQNEQTRLLGSAAKAWLNFYTVRNEVLFECAKSEWQSQEEAETGQIGIDLQLSPHRLNALQSLTEEMRKKFENAVTQKRTSQKGEEDLEQILRVAGLQLLAGAELAKILVQANLGPILSEDGTDVESFSLAGALQNMLEESSRRAKRAIAYAGSRGVAALAATERYLLAISNQRGEATDQLEALRDFWVAAGLAQLQVQCMQ